MKLKFQGIQIIDHRTPVDMLRDILLQFGPDSSHASYFTQLHGLVNVGDMVLTILCTEYGVSSAVKVNCVQSAYERSKDVLSSFL